MFDLGTTNRKLVEHRNFYLGYSGKDDATNTLLRTIKIKIAKVNLINATDKEQIVHQEGLTAWSCDYEEIKSTNHQINQIIGQFTCCLS